MTSQTLQQVAMLLQGTMQIPHKDLPAARSSPDLPPLTAALGKIQVRPYTNNMSRSQRVGSTERPRYS